LGPWPRPLRRGLRRLQFNSTQVTGSTAAGERPAQPLQVNERLNR